MKKILKLAFVGVIGASLMLAGCSKDFTSDIQNLDSKISALDQKVNDLQKAINDGSVIKNVEALAGGIKITLSNGESYTITNGKDGDKGDKGDKGDNGKDGSVITIGDNGNWFIDGKDTGKPSRGAQGPQGIQGETGPQGPQGETGPQGPQGETGPTGAAGNYWKPNTEENVWEEYNGATNEKTGKKDGTVFPAGTLTAVWDKTNGILEIANVKDADGVVKIDLNNKLTSLVTIPQLYLEGIEAAEYDYAIEVQEDNKSPRGKVVKFETISEDQGANIVRVTTRNYAVIVPANEVVMSSLSTVSYYANPQNFKANNAKWSFNWKDCATLTRAILWTPSITKTEGADSNGEIKVSYTVANPQKMTPKAAGEDVSVISLNGINSDGSDVNSDFAAIAPFKEALKSFAFKKANNYFTVENCQIKEGKHLYATIEDAIHNGASVPVQYNKGAFDLNSILDIHVLAPAEGTLHTVGETEASYSIEEFLAKYPDAKISYEEVEYQLGEYTDTPEDKFCALKKVDENWFFQPQYYVDGGSLDCPVGSETGISAVGRKPIVCVTLSYNGKVVLHGYFKILISKKVTVSDFELRNFGTIPYICDPQPKSSVWDDMTDKILEKNLGMDHNMFHNVFITDSLTYIKKGGEFVECDKVGNDYKYGTLYFRKDEVQGPVNDRFDLTVSNPQAAAIRADKNSTVTLYMRFHEKNTEQNFVFIGFTVTIAPNAKVNFGEKNPSYWFNHKGGQQNMVAMNVRIPDKWIEDGSTTGESKSVMEFTKKFDDYFVNNKVVLNLVGPSEYTSIWSALQKGYDFTFSSSQKFDSNFRVSTDGKKLYYGSTAAADKIAEIETVNEGGVLKQQIKYEDTDKAKKVLNLYEYKTDNKDINDPVAYCNITLNGTYDHCAIPVDGNKLEFEVAFVRPVKFIGNDDTVINDAEVSGGYVEIGSLFNGYDWNTVDDPMGHKLFEGVYDPVTGALTGFAPCVQVSPIDPTYTVNWYSYYGVKSVKFDIDKLQTNQTGSFKNMFGNSGVNPAAIIHLAKRNDVLVALPNKVDIDYPANINNLYDYILYFHNNMGVVKDYQVKIPVEVEYAWGKVSNDIIVNVKATK